MEPDILFVGAGPVGLFTAINAKLLNPEQEILMLERNEKYSRHHILIIDINSYKGTHLAPEFQAILNHLHGKVPTNEIEERLRNYAITLGIKIEHTQVTDILELSQTYPKVHTIIGADGAKSLVRKQIFNDEKVIDKNLQYIVEVKYKSSQLTQKLGILNTVEGLSQISHFVREHVGKMKDGQTPVSLFFFVNKKTYDQVYAKGAAGLKFSDLQAGTKEMTDLTNSIRPWLALRRHHKNDIPIPKSEKIAAVALNKYKSKFCVKVIEGVRYVLVGDAKLGIPYFRALNAGLIGGIKAAKLISQKEENNSYKNDQYNADMDALASKEIATAHKKNSQVHLGRGIANYIRFGFIKINHDVMSDGAKKAMKNARVTPLPIHRKYRYTLTGILSTLVLTAIFAAILIPTGGLGFLPLGIVTTVGISVFLSVAIVTSLWLIYEVSTAFITFSRNVHHKFMDENNIRLSLDQAFAGPDVLENDAPSPHYAHPANLLFIGQCGDISRARTAQFESDSKNKEGEPEESEFFTSRVRS